MNQRMEQLTDGEKQFYASVHRAFHPSRGHIDPPPGPRQMKSLLRDRYATNAELFLTDGVLPNAEQHKELVEPLYTDTVPAEVG